MVTTVTSRRLGLHLRTAVIGSLFCLAAACDAWAADRDAAVQELKLTPKEAHCLADNAELLLRDEGDPVLFYFDLCLIDKATRGGTRQSLPDPRKRQAEANQRNEMPDQPVKIGKVHLRCIQAKRAENPAFLDTNPVVLNASACKR